ncbi:MAG: hypothetical protein JKX84_08260 [Flavobacteriales bacterium]|nr:hypothetical protein [Flavobacteriales bacterium]
MEFLDIEIEKSKEEEKLIFPRKSIFDNLIDIFFWVMIIGIFPFISAINIIRKFENNESIVIPILYLLISVALGCLCIYSLRYSDKLKRIRGISGNENRRAIKEIGTELKWESERHNQQITVLSKDWSWYSANWGRQIVIIYDRKDILINCITFMRYGMRSPFHWFSSRRIEKGLKEKFEHKIKTPRNFINSKS